MLNRIALLLSLGLMACSGTSSESTSSEEEGSEEGAKEPSFDLTTRIELGGGSLSVSTETDAVCCTTGMPDWQGTPVRALLEPDQTAVPLGWAVFLAKDDIVAVNQLSAPGEYATPVWRSETPARREGGRITLTVPPEGLPGGVLRVWAGMRGNDKVLTVQDKELVTRRGEGVVPYVLVDTGREASAPEPLEAPATPLTAADPGGAPSAGDRPDPAGGGAGPGPAGEGDGGIGEPAPQGDPAEAEGQPPGEGEAPVPPDAGAPDEAEGQPVDAGTSEAPTE